MTHRYYVFLPNGSIKRTDSFDAALRIVQSNPGAYIKSGLELGPKDLLKVERFDRKNQMRKLQDYNRWVDRHIEAPLRFLYSLSLPVTWP